MPWLTACAQDTSPRLTHDPAMMRKAVANACGTPTRWSAAQAHAVADVMVRNAGDVGMQVLAPEWERLDKQVRTCRSERSRP